MVVSTEIITINYNALALFRVYVHSTRHRDRPMTTADGFVMHISIEFHRRLTSLVIIRFIGMLGSLPADVAICSPATTQKTINKQTLTNDWLWFGRAHSHVLGCTWCAQVLGVEGPMQRGWACELISLFYHIFQFIHLGASVCCCFCSSFILDSGHGVGCFCSPHNTHTPTLKRLLNMFGVFCVPTNNG